MNIEDLKKEMEEVIVSMKQDLKKVKRFSERPYLNDYENGYSEGVIDIVTANVEFMEKLSERLNKVK